MPYSLKLLKKLMAFIACCFFLAPSYAQINSGLVLPSPNNRFLGNTAALSSTSDVGVDLYTGSLMVNVPLCQVVSKDLTIPVSLSYIGGKGIKVQDFASQAGLGWLVNAGGSVSRVVRAFPDEQSNGYLGTGHAGQQVAAWKVSGAALPGSFTTTPPTSDGEPDVFFIKTPFFSFQFTFDENGNAVVSNNNGVKIIPRNFFSTSNYSNSSFEAIDEIGTHYYFGSTSASKEYTNATIYGNSNTFPSSWYLDKIATFNDKDVVTFDYTAAPGNDALNHYGGTVTWNAFNSNYDTATPVTTTLVPPKYLSRINGGYGKIDFTYAFDRLDDPNAARLVNIVQSINQTPFTLNTYTFSQSYFGSPSTDANRLRLRLDSIRVKGSTSTTATPITIRSFTYNLDHPISSRKAFAEVDLWGYQNFYIPKTFTPFPGNNRDPDLAGTLLGVLTGIKELSGGSWNIQFELNDFNNSNANKTVGGLRVKQLSQTMPTGENLYKTYSYTDASNISTGRIFSPSYTIIGYIWGSGIGAINQVLSECPSEVYDLNGNFVGYSSVKVTEKNGGYTVATFSNFNDFPDLLNYLDPQQQNAVPDVTSSTSYAFKRGLPLSVTVYNAANQKISEDLTPLTAYTALTSPAGKKSWGYKWNTVSYSLPGTSGYNSYSSVYFTPYENYRLTTQVHRDYDQLNPSAFLETTTTYTYSAADLRQVKTATTIDSKGQTFVKIVYHPGDNDIPRLAAGEQTIATALATANNVSAVIHQTENKNGSTRETHNTYTATQMGSVQNLYLTKSDLYIGGTAIKQKTFKYDPSSSNLSSVKLTGGKATAYQYGYDNLLPIAAIDNAEDNFTISSALTTQYGSVWTTGNQYTATFTNDAVGNIVLSAVASPGETYSINYTLSGAGSASGTLCIARSSTTCSSPESVTLPNMPIGNYTITVSAQGGSSPFHGVGYSYSYLKPVVTAARGFFYEGFESGSNTIQGSAHGGRGYFSGTYTVNFPLPDARKYFLQYWTWVNGKWSIRQQVYTGTVAISGVLDDIRVFPSDALLTTFSYDPQVGKISETDPAGNTVSYEYDGLGRLSIIRDNDKNIISKTCVNYYGGPNGCPDAPVYTNTVYTRTFTRNNCAAGYAPGDVVYTVPAGKYSSVISQADADQLAANEANLNGQTNANTLGTCSLIYNSAAKSGDYTRNNCPVGFNGTTVTYSVPAGRYTSIISQADADQKAINDVTTNGQNYANTNGLCNSSQVQKYGSLTYNGTTSATFTSTIPGDINLSLNGEPLYYYSISYSLTGAASRSGTLCVTRTSYTCGSPSSIVLSNMPAGTYTISISSSSGTSPYRTLNYSYWGAP